MAKRKTCDRLEVEWSRHGHGPVKVRGPAFKLTTLPVGAKDKHGDVITKHTPDWARIGYERMSGCATMHRPRQAGHEIEGHVTIHGKRYSAFTSAPSGDDQGMIIVRTKD